MFLYSCMNSNMTSLGQIESIDAVCIKVCPHLHNLQTPACHHIHDFVIVIHICKYHHLDICSWNFKSFWFVVVFWCILGFLYLLEFYHSAFSAVCILCLQVNFQICATARNLDTTPSSSARIRRKKYSQKSQLDIFDKISK